MKNQHVAIPPRGSAVVDTGQDFFLEDRTGSVTVPNTAPYGALVGKVVTVAADGGASFDTPLEPRPR